jgi:hypothetical protein
MPHIPQFMASVMMFTQEPLQSVVSEGHSQLPDAQL